MLGNKFELHELPLVSVPTEEEQSERELVSLRDYLVCTKTRHKNKLHAIFMACGHPEIRSKHIAKETSRNEKIEELLTGFAKVSAQMIADMITDIENTIKELEQKFIDMLLEHPEETSLLMSIPGVGRVSAATILAYVGDIDRFASARQLCNYAGIVPKMDCSGQRIVVGGISHRGNPHLRRVMVQGAWANVLTKMDSPLKGKYSRLIQSKPKQVAIVAVARELLTLVYLILKHKTLYSYVSIDYYEEKLKGYGLLEVLEYRTDSLESERSA